MFTELR